MDKFILTASCHATTGVVAAVSGFLAERDCYILGLEQFDDESTDILDGNKTVIFHGV